MPQCTFPYNPLDSSFALCASLLRTPGNVGTRWWASHAASYPIHLLTLSLFLLCRFLNSCFAEEEGLGVVVFLCLLSVCTMVYGVCMGVWCVLLLCPALVYLMPRPWLSVAAPVPTPVPYLHLPCDLLEILYSFGDEPLLHA